MATRSLVLHADDFGMNSAVNSGILRSFRDGLLTSTSLLANAPNAADACSLWPQLIADLNGGHLPSLAMRQRSGDDLSRFDLGIHLNLTQGRPLTPTYPSELLNQQGQFPGIGPVFGRLRSVGSRFRDAVRRELEAQIEFMLDHQVAPTHLNGHQYVEIMPGVAELVPDLMKKFSIPVIRVARETSLMQTVLFKGRIPAFALSLIKRYYAARFRRLPAIASFNSPASFFGTAHAGLVDRGSLCQFLIGASPNGCTEIGLHPAVQPDGQSIPAEWGDPLAALRPAELDWLCDPAISDLIVANRLRLGRLWQLP